ncbi:MAG: hypothetical protein AAFR12_07455 [Cyanobacteria bacterium J06626_6]
MDFVRILAIRLVFFKAIPNRVTQGLIGITLALLLANAWSYFHLAPGSDWARLLDVNQEENFATAFSVALLLSCSGLLGMIAVLCRDITNRTPKIDLFVNHWGGLSFIFCCMAIDEWTLKHEHLNRILDDHFHTTGFFYYDWVIPGSLFVVAIALLYRQFLLHLPIKTCQRFLIAGSTYVLGVLGMEMVSGYYIDLHGLENIGLLSLLNGIEEALEMFGLVAFIRALMLYMRVICLSDP